MIHRGLVCDALLHISTLMAALYVYIKTYFTLLFYHHSRSTILHLSPCTLHTANDSISMSDIYRSNTNNDKCKVHNEEIIKMNAVEELSYSSIEDCTSITEIQKKARINLKICQADLDFAALKYIDVVGVDCGSNGRSCTTHDVCG